MHFFRAVVLDDAGLTGTQDSREITPRAMLVGSSSCTKKHAVRLFYPRWLTDSVAYT